MQDDGKIIAVGSSENSFAIARYNSNGTLDNTFGVSGKVITNFDGGSRATSVAIQDDGKIVVAGSADYYFDFALARYNTNGTLDNTFGVDGKIITDFTGYSDDCWALAIQDDGKIILAGSIMSTIPYEDFGLARYNTDGSLDNSFDLDGKVITDLGSEFEGASSITIQYDGKIIIAGTSDDNIAVLRYNINGSLDNTFDGDGKVTTDFGTDSDWGTAVSLQIDGKIVVVGEEGYPSADFALVRYNFDGTLDNTFGIGGKVTTDIAGNDNGASAILIQPDGKILVAGYGYDISKDFAIIRYNGDCEFINTSISQTGNTLTATETDAEYQWVDCDNDYAPISGQIDQDFTPIIDGNYAAILTKGFCSDTTDCYSISIVGIFGNSNQNINLYPNPSFGIINIYNINQGSVEIYNLQGQLITIFTVSGSPSTLNLLRYPKGTYLLKVIDEFNCHVSKIILK
ncbi:MAG: T9SS type A sorting domain-containing protein [Bacteroidetes bacterium]|nr:T9SS type A sorting domain-containing protein [Bacteroidota bacterium]